MSLIGKLEDLAGTGIYRPIKVVGPSREIGIVDWGPSQKSLMNKNPIYGMARKIAPLIEVYWNLYELDARTCCVLKWI
jgi:hypothetical protein